MLAVRGFLLATGFADLARRIDGLGATLDAGATPIELREVYHDVRGGGLPALLMVLDAVASGEGVADDLERSGVGKRYPLQELHLEKDGSLVVTIGKDAIALHFGQPPYRDKIEQASRVLSEVARRKAQPSVIFLDNDAHPERVVVRMR